MAVNADLSRAWRPVLEQGSFHTGGKVVPFQDRLVSICGEELSVFFPPHESAKSADKVCQEGEVKREQDDKIVCRNLVKLVPNDGDGVLNFAVCGVTGNIVTTHRKTFLLKCYTKDLELKKSWVGHNDICSDLDYNCKGHFLATVSLDKSVRVWDMDGYFATHAFHGHTNMPTIVRWMPNKLMLLSADDEGQMMLWHLMQKKCVATFNTHLAQVTDMCFLENSRIATVARDSVINVWTYKGDNVDAKTAEMKCVKTIPAYETLEGISSVSVSNKSSISTKRGAKADEASSNEELLVTVGDKGCIRLWDADKGKVVKAVESSHAAKGAMRSLVKSADGKVVTTGEDHNIIYWDVKKEIDGLAIEPHARYVSPVKFMFVLNLSGFVLIFS